MFWGFILLLRCFSMAAFFLRFFFHLFGRPSSQFFAPLTSCFRNFFPEFCINNPKLSVIGLFLNSRVLAFFFFFWISPSSEMDGNFCNECCVCRAVPPDWEESKIMKKFSVSNIYSMLACVKLFVCEKMRRVIERFFPDHFLFCFCFFVFF